MGGWGGVDGVDGARVGRPCTAWRGAATPSKAGCRGFAACGQEGSRGGLLRALSGFRVEGGRGRGICVRVNRAANLGRTAGREVRRGEFKVRAHARANDVGHVARPVTIVPQCRRQHRTLDLRLLAEVKLRRIQTK